MMAAASAAFLDKKVLLLEKNEKLGKKMYITGKGRCNFTNACPEDVFFDHVVCNPKFLMSSIYTFPPDALIRLLNENGLETKIERGRRAFPASDKSSDVIRCMSGILSRAHVEVRLNTRVDKLRKENGGFCIETRTGEIFNAGALIIATGGASYPQTGSTGDGYGFAKAFGHKVVGANAALVPLLEKGSLCAGLAGLTLKNVSFSLYQNEKCVFLEQGEMLFTHTGISGPLVLSASSAVDYAKPMNLRAEIDLKPALSKEKLDARILRDFENYKNKQVKNAVSEMLPNRLVEPMLKAAGILPDKAVNAVTRQERERLVAALKAFPVALRGIAGLGEAIVTRGGVDVRGIDPSTLQSKKTDGLFFAGEVINVDALTGGYNMQIAFSTGYLAGISACKHLS